MQWRNFGGQVTKYKQSGQFIPEIDSWTQYKSYKLICNFLTAIHLRTCQKIDLKGTFHTAEQSDTSPLVLFLPLSFHPPGSTHVPITGNCYRCCVCSTQVPWNPLYQFWAPSGYLTSKTLHLQLLPWFLLSYWTALASNTQSWNSWELISDPLAPNTLVPNTRTCTHTHTAYFTNDW